MDKVRWGVIGAGGIVDRFIRMQGGRRPGERLTFKTLPVDHMLHSTVYEAISSIRL